MTTFGKIEVRSTERKIWRHDKRVGGVDYANRRQAERLGAEKALERRSWSTHYKYPLRKLPYPEWLDRPVRWPFFAPSSAPSAAESAGVQYFKK